MFISGLMSLAVSMLGSMLMAISAWHYTPSALNQWLSSCRPSPFTHTVVSKDRVPVPVIDLCNSGGDDIWCQPSGKKARLLGWLSVML